MPHPHFVPSAVVSRCSIGASLLDQFVGGGRQSEGHGNAERLGSLHVDHELELGYLYDR
jgi:hypothetical protein